MLPVQASALSEAEFADGDVLLYAADGGVTAFDLKGRKPVWTGEAATALSVSGNGKFAAAAARDADHAVVYPDGGRHRGGQVLLWGKTHGRGL